MKGMNRIKRGAGFEGVLRYVFGRDDEHKDCPGVLLGGTMAGADVRQLTREFAAVRALRPDIEKPVWHNSLRLPAGEALSPQQWQSVCDDYLQRMGFTAAHPRVYVLHDDPEGQHVHLVACRVSASGAVYLGRNENLRSTRIIQRLERLHHLTITRGPTYGDDGTLALPARRQLKKGEIDLAVRTGNQPPRLQLQQLLEEVLGAGSQPVQSFVQALQARGVRVIPNIASTGRLNGFSFEIDGVAFKASALGDAYKWSKLQGKVQYDQARDHPTLAELRATAIAHAGTSGTATGDRGAVDAAASGDRTYAAGAAPDSRSLDPSNPAADHADAATQSARTPRESGEPERADQRIPSPDGAHASGRDAAGESRPAGVGAAPQNAATDAAAGGRADADRRDSRGDTGGRWDARFRRASAAKHAATYAPVNERVDAQTLRDARHADPTGYLQAQGFGVRREGRHWSVRDRAGDEIYRVTQKPDGHIVWCDPLGQEGGDLIALVRDIAPGTSFRDAVFALARGAARLQPNPQPQSQAPNPAPALPLKLPIASPLEQARGRSYLAERGIGEATLAHAEHSGMLRYAPDGVLFVGYDEQGQPRSATRRRHQDGAGPNKRELRGSVKAFCPVLPGRPDMVWIVEGGVDALAAQDAARSRGEAPPTVLISGGAGVRSFLDREAIRAILRPATNIVIACDREKDAEIQARTDAQHQQQAERVRGIVVRADVRLWHPPDGCKDVAQWHQRQAESSDLAPLSDTPQFPIPTPTHAPTRAPAQPRADAPIDPRDPSPTTRNSP